MLNDITSIWEKHCGCYGYLVLLLVVVVVVTQRAGLTGGGRPGQDVTPGGSLGRLAPPEQAARALHGPSITASFSEHTEYIP